MKNQKQFPDKEMDYAFNIHMLLGNSIKLVPRLKQLDVCRYLSYLPHKVVDFIVENRLLFINPDSNQMGAYYPPKYYKDAAGVVILNFPIWELKSIERAFVIAHEVAHAFNHNNIVRYKGNIIDKRIKMEEEANRLAIKWLSKRYNKERLRQVCRHGY
jgi:Zn-dependent peptidase ImmA (M78 family)